MHRKEICCILWKKEGIVMDKHNDKEEFEEPSVATLLFRSRIVVLIIILCLLEVVECL